MLSVNRYQKRTLVTESLESRNLLTTIGFTQHEITRADHGAPVAAIPADIDGDGDLDIVSASDDDGKLAWYENTDGQGAFGKQKLVADDVQMRWGNPILVDDLDSDGDVDVIVQSDAIVWYENTDGHGTFSEPQIIVMPIEGEADYHASVGDLDNDGDLDVALKSTDRLAWYENDGQENFSPHELDLTCWITGRSVELGDFDADGHLDLTVMCNNQIVLFPNLAGNGQFGSRRTIANAQFSHSSIDMDGDEDLDLLVWDRWFENVDGRGAFEAIEFSGTTILTMADIDGDGDMDAVSSVTADNHSNPIWRENTDGRGTFGHETIIPGNGSSSAFAGDLNSDGRMDLIFVSRLEGSIVWNANIDDRGTFGPAHTIASKKPGEGNVALGDLDGDGDMDAVMASLVDRKIVWHDNKGGDNKGGDNGFGEARVIDQRNAPARPSFPLSHIEAHTVDMDGDDDLDVVAGWYVRFPQDAAPLERSIVWYENTDGRGSFGEAKPIAEFKVPYVPFRSLEVEDLDGDGDSDVIVIDDQLRWYENIDGSGNFELAAQIASGQFSALHVADLDGDDEKDVVVVTFATQQDGVFWFRNLGTGTFSERRSLIEDAAPGIGGRTVALGDMDNDGDHDLLSVRYVSECSGFDEVSTCRLQEFEVMLHANDGVGGLDVPRRIHSDTQIDRVMDFAPSVELADMNGDGFLDVLWPVDLAWLENHRASGNYTRHQISSEPSFAIAAADIDGDTDVDILSLAQHRCDDWQTLCSAHKLVWIESDAADGEQHIPGDADGDGEVAFADFLLLSQNFGKRSDAVWADGDFTKDGKVDFTDFLILSENFGANA